MFAGHINVDIKDMIYNDKIYFDIDHNAEKSFWSILQHHNTVLNFLTKYTGRLLTIDKDAKLTEITNEDERDFEDMAFILMTDLDMKLNWEKFGENYIVGILIKKVHDVNFEEVPIYNRRIAQQRDTTKISRRFGYITTELDLSQDTLKRSYSI